jgi:hypothetical protein
MFEGCNDFYDELHFNRMLDLERKRSLRSKKPFILILINITSFMEPCPLDGLNQSMKALASSFRKTDFRGWYMRESVIGIVFTELDSVGPDTRAILFGKMQAALAAQIDPDDLRKIYVTFHTFPSSGEDAVSCGRFDLERYRGLTDHHARMRSPSKMNRLMDILGSFAAFVKTAPILHRFRRPEGAVSRGSR